MKIANELEFIMEASADEKKVVKEMLIDLKSNNEFFDTFNKDIIFSGDIDDIEVEEVRVSKFSDYLHDIVLDVLNKKPSDKELSTIAENIHKFLKNAVIPFDAVYKDEDIEGKIKILKTSYDKKKDLVKVDKFKVVDIQAS